MGEHKGSVYEDLVERYRSGDVPWDDPLPPPEVIEFVTTRPVGKALDLGCGFGRAAIYLARLGWEVDGIDFIPEAVAEAARRSRAADVTIRFHISSITDLGYLRAGYDFALDVGCGHNLDASGWQIYVASLRRLLRSGGSFMLFGRLLQDNGGAGEQGPRGMDLAMVRGIFEHGFGCVWEQRGVTEMTDQPAWASIWMRFQRQ
ncbi:MAG: class I SAM-dependent methyltransferase [Candidatus Promineifilaceae bacterium]|nr:class I SAM-dependent methyltransferase [Candidatus Promineifilaceae bacterium]